MKLSSHLLSLLSPIALPAALLGCAEPSAVPVAQHAHGAQTSAPAPQADRAVTQAVTVDATVELVPPAPSAEQPRVEPELKLEPSQSGDGCPACGMG